MKIIVSVLVLIVLAGCSVEESGKVEEELKNKEGSFSDSTKLKYHGYFYKNEVLENEEELKEIRKFANMIVFATAKFDPITPEIIRTVGNGDFDKLDPKIFDDMSARIKLLESMDYITIGEFTFAPLILTDRFEEYKKALQYLKKRVPEMDQLDYWYFWDEPDINYYPDTGVMEKYIAEFKRVFPKVKVTSCYAIPDKEFLVSVPPQNIDMLMIDPYYFTDETGHHSAANFEKYYRSRLALSLEWISKWDKPWLMVGDAFGSTTSEGKKMPTADVSLWYYMTALTQQNCNGLLWFQYGYIPTIENITGVTVDGANDTKELIELHKEVGNLIFSEPSQLGLGMERKLNPIFQNVIDIVNGKSDEFKLE
ncbi:MAG: hypothetical protein ABFS12_13385 [Bacteroidota bacterium]